MYWCVLSPLNLRALISRMVNGMFLLRVSQRSGTQLVVSVWYKAECKHFKIFQVKVRVCACVRACVQIYSTVLLKSKLQINTPYKLYIHMNVSHLMSSLGCS